MTQKDIETARGQIQDYVNSWFDTQARQLAENPEWYEETSAEDLIDAFWNN